MPDEKVVDSVEPEEAWEHRGGILYLRETLGMRRWMRLLQDERLPDVGEKQTVVLTGRTNRYLNEIGECNAASVEGREIYALFLDDLHPKEVEFVERALRDMAPGMFSPQLMRKVWDAFLVHVYLHEVGHAHFLMRNGWGGGSGRHEPAAERFCWKWMRRLYGREVVLGVMMLFWMLAADEY